jgi:hypothetical protein
MAKQDRSVRDGRGWWQALGRSDRIERMEAALARKPHLTNGELALELGVTPSTVARYRRTQNALLVGREASA